MVIMQYSFFIMFIFLCFNVMVAGPCMSRDTNAKDKDNNALPLRPGSQFLVPEHLRFAVASHPFFSAQCENNGAACCVSVTPNGKVLYHSPLLVTSEYFNNCWRYHRGGFGIHMRPRSSDYPILYAATTLRPSLRHTMMTGDLIPYSYREFELSREGYQQRCQDALIEKCVFEEKKSKNRLSWKYFREVEKIR